MIKLFDWKWSTLIMAVILNSLYGAMKVGEMKKEIEIQFRSYIELKSALQELTKEIKITREALCEIKGQINNK